MFGLCRGLTLSHSLRRLVLLVVVLHFGLNSAASLNADQLRLYIGTYTSGDSSSQGIYTCLFDDESGKLSAPKLAAELTNPSFLAVHPSGQYLYAVIEVSNGDGRGDGEVAALKIASDGSLTLINRVASSGGAPCHCNVDASGTNLLVANYVGGSVAVFPIGEDGGLQEASSVILHEGSSVNEARQESPHAHSINLSADNRFAYAADLGTDRIYVYEFNSARHTLRASKPAAALVTPGGGPRHFAIHPSGKFAWTNCELSMIVTGFRRDHSSGRLFAIQEITTIPGGYTGRCSTAECVVHPGGGFLYVSNRGHETITVYAIDQETGLLSYVENEATGGREPRNFFISPTGRWLLAENQNTDTINVFSIDPETGALTATDTSVAVGRPVCIRAAVPVSQ